MTTETIDPPARTWVLPAVAAAATVIVSVGVAVVTLGVDAPATRPTASGLATINALLNGTSSLCLLAGFFFIRTGRQELHKKAMLSAFAISSLFLVTYLIHHAQVGSVRFQGSGLVRTIYLSLLIPHIVLAAPVVPLAVLTLWRGWTLDRARHRRLARWTLPIWLYVSVSGVLVYWMLYHL